MSELSAPHLPAFAILSHILTISRIQFHAPALSNRLERITERLDKLEVESGAQKQQIVTINETLQDLRHDYRNLNQQRQEVTERINAIETNVTRAHFRLDEHLPKFNTVEQRLDALDRRVQVVERQMESLGRVERQIETLRGDVTVSLRQLDEQARDVRRLDTMNQDLNRRFLRFSKRVEPVKVCCVIL